MWLGLTCAHSSAGAVFLDKTLSRMLSLSASLIGCVLQIKSVETSIDTG